MQAEIIINALGSVLSAGNNMQKKEFYNEILQASDWDNIYFFFKEHAILPLFTDCIRYIPNASIKKPWKQAVYSNVYTYACLLKEQEHVLNEFQTNMIPVVVLKGTSVAKYYPKPNLRTMGDIDLLVKPEDYEKATILLMNTGFVETTSRDEAMIGRHRTFRYRGISIELHHFFSFFVDEDKASALDSMLFDAISINSSELPDEECGLVILSHIRQHLESGIGLRQIIDWYMFVKAFLDDKMWYSSFQDKTKITGLEALAITVTRMCQIHLGLTTENITWCKSADEALCGDLMIYVMQCGNFGRSREILQSGSVSKIPALNHPIQMIRYIQERGERNWEVLKKYPWLKPFASIYQSGRYIRMAVNNKVGSKQIMSIYSEGQERNKMFKALGLK